MKLGRFQWAFIGIAVLTVIIFAPSDDEGQAKKSGSLNKPTSDTSGNATTIATNSNQGKSLEVGRVELERLSKVGSPPGAEGEVYNIFKSQSWYVPPPPPPPPPPEPTAPKMPFTFIGHYGDVASRKVILSKADQVYIVTVGDIIENTYRVEKLEDNVVVLKYLPLNIDQSLRIGDAS
jgi:hypothetical protein